MASLSPPNLKKNYHLKQQTGGATVNQKFSLFIFNFQFICWLLVVSFQTFYIYVICTFHFLLMIESPLIAADALLSVLFKIAKF